MARADLHERLREARALREAQQRVRARRNVTRRDGARYEVDGRWRVGFCGNDYLGLAQQFGVVAALQDAAARDGVGIWSAAITPRTRRWSARSPNGWNIRAAY
jgi:8-amino-7-oxononanoate synthase